MDFPGGSDGKESACNVGDPGSIPGSGRSSGERNNNPLLVFLPGESHGQRSLEGYSPWGQRVTKGHDRATATDTHNIKHLSHTHLLTLDSL